MSFTKASAAERAISDLANRLKISTGDLGTATIVDKEYPDMSLGAPVPGEMSAQMISSGWQIRLSAKGKTYEYRADKYQLRLHNFNGANYVIES